MENVEEMIQKAAQAIDALRAERDRLIAERDKIAQQIDAINKHLGEINHKAPVPQKILALLKNEQRVNRQRVIEVMPEAKLNTVDASLYRMSRDGVLVKDGSFYSLNPSHHPPGQRKISEVKDRIMAKMTKAGQMSRKQILVLEPHHFATADAAIRALISDRRIAIKQRGLYTLTGLQKT